MTKLAPESTAATGVAQKGRWKVPVAFAGLTVVAFVLFVLLAEDAPTRFNFSARTDLLQLPVAEFPALASGVVVTILTAVVAVWSALLVRRGQRVPSWMPIAGAAVLLFGFLAWAAAGALLLIFGGLLLAAIFSASACAIVYELLIGSTSAYFLGDSVQQFSVTIGLFLASMGLGAWLSRAVVDHLLERFIALELWLAAVGGSCVPILYFAYLYTDGFRYWMILLIVAIGALVGLELPLLTRMLQQHGGLRTVLANVLSIDYLGSLAAALLFPYLLLPLLGAFNTSLTAGLLNVAVGLVLLVAFWSRLARGPRLRLLGLGLFVAGALGLGLVMANPIRERLESELYTDQIIYSEQSPYQQIVLTRWQDEIRLYLDRHLQFSSADEYRYHESLVHPAMSLADQAKRVLIIGGGDGLSAREILRHSQVERVDLVDLDPEMLEEVQRTGKAAPAAARTLCDRSHPARVRQKQVENAVRFTEVHRTQHESPGRGRLHGPSLGGATRHLTRQGPDGITCLPPCLEIDPGVERRRPRLAKSRRQRRLQLQRPQKRLRLGADGVHQQGEDQHRRPVHTF